MVIVQALVKTPAARRWLTGAPALLLDEAASALDAGTARRLSRALGSRTLIAVDYRQKQIGSVDQVVVLGTTA